MRIVGGQFRGRPLAAPEHEGTRPTSDRAREAVFNILAHGIPGFELAGARVLDLFAGTGALGLEALSRGAAFCLFVEQEVEARALIRRNVEALGHRCHQDLSPQCCRSGPRRPERRLRAGFLDPPYGQGLAERALASAAAGSWLTPGAIAVIEGARGRPSLPAGFRSLDRAVGATLRCSPFAGSKARSVAMPQLSRRPRYPSAAGSRPHLYACHRRAQHLLRMGQQVGAHPIAFILYAMFVSAWCCSP
jgi:16S rRNA (guanine966-N2)-methyltransferase